MQLKKNITLTLNNREVELLHQLTEFARRHVDSKRQPERRMWAAHLTLGSESELNEMQSFIDKIFEL